MDPIKQQMDEHRKKIQFSPNFDIVLMSSETNKDLNMRLKPSNTLSENYSDLADKLGFNIREIDYIGEKPYPVLYIFDQYTKRAIQNPKLNTSMKYLHEIFLQMRRFDAAEKIEQELEALHEKEEKELLQKEQIIKAKIRRQLFGKDEFHEAKFQRNDNSHAEECEEKTCDKFDKDDNATKEDIYIAYCADNEKHVQTVHRFAKKLKKCGINATTDLYERLEYEYDRGFYIQQSLLKADKVLVVCSEKFNKFYDCYLNKNTDSLEPSEKEEFKKVTFYMRIITADIFEAAGCNGKYIPVCFGSKAQQSIPSVLKNSTQYIMERDFISLKYRLLGIERYKLPPLPKEKPVIQSENLSNGFRLLTLLRRTEK